jgi:hypothetical protein
MARSFTTVRRAAGIGMLALLTATGGLALAAPASAVAQTRYVAIDGSDLIGEGPNPCTNQAQPCKTIQHAVNEAAAGDTVSVGAGTYLESVQIHVNLTVTGSTTGTTTVTGPDSTPTLPTFLILPDFNGLDVTLRHLSISHNHNQPGVVAGGTNLTIADTQISDNDGNGVLDFFGTLTMSNSTVSDIAFGNTFPNVSGAGVALVAATGVIDESTLRDNAAAGLTTLDFSQFPLFARTLAAPAAPPATAATLRHSTVSGNAQGGVVNLSASVTVDTSTVSGNVGGGVVSGGGTASVKNSTVSDTVPFSDGGTEQGGVIALPPLAQARNSQFVPTARERSASSRSLEQLLGDRVSAVRRAAPQLAPAAALPTDAVVSVSGSIVAKQQGLADCFGPIVDNGYNLSSDAGNSCKFSTATHDQVKTDPKLGSLVDNGGPTLTQLLKKGSPAIDVLPTGKAGCTSGASDQRGVARPQPTGGKCDVGSVELAAKAIVIHPAALPHGTVGTPYHQVITATGGAYPTYEWSLAPGTTLPGGLSFTSGGVLHGTPTTAGTYHLTVSVNDPTLKAYTLVIDAAAPADNGASPIANTGTDVVPMATTGGGAVIAGLLLLLTAGLIGRRPGRHRAG